MNEYREKYEIISRLLDDNPQLVSLVHRDLVKMLSQSKNDVTRALQAAAHNSNYHNLTTRMKEILDTLQTHHAELTTNIHITREIIDEIKPDTPPH